MDAGMVVAVVVVLALLVALAAFVRHMARHDHPGKLAGHGVDDEWAASPPPVGDVTLGAGPAGADAEPMAVPEPGDAAPGVRPEQEQR